MTGLLYKDFYATKRQILTFLFFIIVFTISLKSNVVGAAVIYAIMMPMTAMAYDEQSKWDKLAVMMPFTVKQLVLEKYLLGYITMFLFILTAVIGLFIGSLINLDITFMESVITVLGSILAGMFMLATQLPVMFKYGVQKGRLKIFVAMFVVVLIITGAGAGVLSILPENINAISLRKVLIVELIGVVLLCFFNLISIKISEKVYIKKFG